MSVAPSRFAYRIAGQRLWAWRQQAQQQAQTADIPPAEVDWLLQGLCQIDRLALRLGMVAQQLAIPSTVTFEDLQERWQRRVRDRVPVQHLVGMTYWRTFTLQVSPDVLIPRPETELLIDLAVALVSQHPNGAELAQGIWVDMGTGSGAIALGLAVAFPQAQIIATDISPAALAIAQHNAQINGLGDRVEFRQGSWFTPMDEWQGQLAGLVSNPPYIPSKVVLDLQPEVVRHEPHLALDGGKDGLLAVRQLAAIAPQFLVGGGLWLVELMMGQPQSVGQLLNGTGAYNAIAIHPDLAGVERFVSAQRAPDHQGRPPDSEAIP